MSFYHIVLKHGFNINISYFRHFRSIKVCFLGDFVDFVILFSVNVITISTFFLFGDETVCPTIGRTQELKKVSE